MSIQNVQDVLSRSTLRSLRSRAEDKSEWAELIAAEIYRFRATGDTHSWYDGVNESGSKFEVKSCEKRVGNEYTRDGRFRLWKRQTRRLTGADNSPTGTAWFVFVLFDDGHAKKIRRMHAATVQDRVDGWNQSGHDERDKQKKIYWKTIFG